ncbi:MAG: hypothetical protein IIC60_08330 [Proteobacteria bacterium]|nr:hypothetical protein [Pseudomonadota bacterium]
MKENFATAGSICSTEEAIVCLNQSGRRRASLHYCRLSLLISPLPARLAGTPRPFETPCLPAAITVAQAALPYVTGTPYRVPMIDRCINHGDGRIECIEHLPAAVLAQCERWEQSRAQQRRALFNVSRGGFGVQPGPQR